jgi:hypothetical protein
LKTTGATKVSSEFSQFIQFYTGVCEERILVREESLLLETVARERLVKIQQAGKGLAEAVVICDL